MRVLQQMDILLNNRTEPQKQVTFEELIQQTIPQTVPQPRVEQTERSHIPVEPVSPPRVPLQEAPAPRVETTFSSRKASNLPQEAKTTSYSKTRRVEHGAGLTTRSKYAQALLKIANRQFEPRTRSTYIMELAQAILDDNQEGRVIEFANEVFDKETGELLKYRKLITHPRYCEAWTHSSANEFG